jgi:uncharacterized protein (TIGR03435 family)
VTGRTLLHYTIVEKLGEGGMGVVWMPSADPSSIFAAVQTALEKIGLKLESTSGTEEFLVIDHVERPSRN